MKKPSVSSRRAMRPRKDAVPVSNFERVAKRLRKDRLMTAVTLRMPVDVVEDLKRIAPVLGHSGYQPLIRFYVGRGLREDLESLEGSDLEALVASLRRRGVDEAILAKAIAETSGVKS